MKFSFVLFVTGSVVCNGVKSMAELPVAERYLDLLLQYKETDQQLAERNAKAGRGAKRPRSDADEPTTEQAEHDAALQFYNAISRDFRTAPDPSAPARERSRSAPRPARARPTSPAWR